MSNNENVSIGFYNTDTKTMMFVDNDLHQKLGNLATLNCELNNLIEEAIMEVTPEPNDIWIGSPVLQLTNGYQHQISVYISKIEKSKILDS